MATVFRNLWVNWVDKRLQQSLINGSEFVLPPFYKYESVPFRIYICEPDPDDPGPGSFSLVNVAPLTLTVSINDTLDDATPLAQQQVWTSDTTLNKFEGTLDLNTSLMNAYIASTTAGVPAYFQIDVSQAGGQPTPIYQRLVTLFNSVTQPTSTSPDVTKVYRTADESDGLYLTQFMRPGQTVTMLSPSGNYSRTIGVNDDGSAPDVTAPYPPV